MSLSLPYMHERAECPSVINLSQQTLTLMRLTFRTENFRAWYSRNVPSLGLACWVTVDCSCVPAALGPFCELLSIETTSFITDVMFLLNVTVEPLKGTFEFVCMFSKEKNKERKQFWARYSSVICLRRHASNYVVSSYVISKVCRLKKVKKEWHKNIYDKRPNYSLREWKHSKMNVTEEYCQAVGFQYVGVWI
jgi:hypothetical protein